MKSCVVGNGPSGKGLGRIIDACDFVVRIKEYWTFGAEDTGAQIDAWAWYGQSKDTHRPYCEHWVTQSIPEFRRREEIHHDGFARLEQIVSGGLRLWFIEHSRVMELEQHLDAFASTGLRAIAMALARCPDELLITGFDAMANDDPDARGPQRPPCHDMRKEKQLLFELDQGQWLGKLCKTRVTWLGRRG